MADNGKYIIGRIKEPTYSVSIPNGSQKMKELMIYVAEKCFDAPTFGAVILNKILYRSDFAHFQRYGMPITGAKYFKLEQGPAPYPLIPLQRELLQDGSAILVDRPYFDKTQKRLVANRQADLSLFKATEISVVDEFIQEQCRLTATEASQASHGVAWHVRELEDFIPYEAAYLSDSDPDEFDIEKARLLNGQA